LGVDTERPLRIDHIRLARYGRLVNSLGWLFTRKRSREAWLVLMNTGEVRVYDVHKRTPDPQEQAPILSVPSPRGVETKVRRQSLRSRVGKRWRRVHFTGRERAPGIEWGSVVGHAGEVFLEGLGPVGEVFDWSKDGLERMRNTRRRRAARAAWKTVLSVEDGWTAVPGNVEPDHAAPAASGEAPTSTS
jgi:hypothetical protein